MVHCCGLEPMQAWSTALPPAAASRHGTSPLCCSSVGYTEPVGGGAGACGAAGSGQACSMLPEQVAICSAVLLVVLAPGSSRHRPEPWLTTLLAVPWLQVWVPLPLQVPSTTGVPGVVPLPWVSRHRPLIVMVPPGS